MENPRPRSTLHTHGHTLSNDSRYAELDIFFFWPRRFGQSALIVGGINSTLNPDILVKEVMSWFRLIEPSFKDFGIYPADITALSLISFQATPKNNAQALAPTDTLEPNTNYCCYKGPDADYTQYPFGVLGKKRPFSQLKELAVEYPNHPAHSARLELYTVPQSIQDEVRERDQHRCFLTRALGDEDSPVTINWIFPPTWAREVKFGERSDAYMDSGNAAMMRKDIADAMHENAFGIDVDNEFRVIWFDPEFSHMRDKLPKKLPFLEQHEPLLKFLRKHFRYCLFSYFFVEDIESAFSAFDLMQVQRAMEEKDEESLKYLKNEDRWDSPAGEELWGLLENICEEKEKKASKDNSVEA